LRASIEAAIAIGGESMLAIERETWRDKSSRGFSFYRRIEAVFGKGRNAFGKLSVTYEAPEAISTGSAAPLLETAKGALPGDDRIVDRLSSTILPAFAWADGVSSRLSDAYRSGMCFNFLLAALAVVWAADTGAYFTGRRFGKRKLSPRISPNKTVEGMVGGLTCGVLAGLLFAWFAGMTLAQVPAVAAVALAAALFSVIGDLFESLLKRHVGAKDSGNLIPGHGGMLDRVDSFLFAAPVAYFYVVSLLH
jgi:hypothetical protein